MALAEVLNNTGGLWFGWSGKIVDDAEGDDVHVLQAGPVKLATVDLSREDHDAYYSATPTACCGRCSITGSTWPTSTPATSAATGASTSCSRASCCRCCAPTTSIWVHDYHLIPLAAELRALGCQQRIGFFLHIPLPPPLILAAIPGHDWLIRALFAYDLVGFQSKADLRALRRLRRDRGARAAAGRAAAGAPSAGPCMRAPSRSASTSRSSPALANGPRPWRCTSA